MDGNHESFFGVCAFQVSGFMTAMTRLLAARASVIGPDQLGEPLAQILANFELTKWSKLFDEDFSAFNHRLENWVNFDEMYFPNVTSNACWLKWVFFPINWKMDRSISTH